MSKISSPSKFLIEFYIYYSNFTLILTWILAPLTFYIIWTQSKTIGKFKWFIFHHCFWCLLCETAFGTAKPILLCPIPGGYQMGFFRYFGDYKVSIALTIICFIFITNVVFGVCATLGARYLKSFPNAAFNWLNVKTLIIIAVLAQIIGTGLLWSLMYKPLTENYDSIKEWAIEFDPTIVKYFKNEQTLFIIPYPFIKAGATGGFVIMVLILLSVPLIIGYFFYQLLRTKKSLHFTNKVQRNLIFISLAQAFLATSFLFAPCAFYIVLILFQINHSASAMTIALCIIMTHSSLEFIVTLLCVTPYRIFVFKKLRLSRFTNDVTPLPSNDIMSTNIHN